MNNPVTRSMHYIKLGIAPKERYNYALRKWQRVLWKVTLWTWRAFILLLIGIAIYNLF